jgi:hypothetical protein
VKAAPEASSDTGGASKNYDSDIPF